MKIAALTAILLSIVISGCIAVTDPVCDAVPKDSYSVICRLAEKLGTTPEAMASVLKVGNLGALAGDVYTAGQALAFIENIRAELKAAQADGLAYVMVRKIVSHRYGRLPTKVKAVFVILEEFMPAEAGEIGHMTLSPYDCKLLYRHLDAQQKMVLRFAA